MEYLPHVLAVGGASIIYALLNGRRRRPAKTWVSPPEDHLPPFPTGLSFVTEPNGLADVRRSEKGIASSTPQTLVAAFQEACQKKGDEIAMKWERPHGQWHQYTFKEYEAVVKKATKSLIHLGVQQHESTAIIGFNSPEWFVAFMGTVSAGCKAAGIYGTNGPEACLYVAEHCEARVVLLDDKKQLEKFLKIRDQLPKLVAIVMWADDVPSDANSEGKCPVMSWTEFLDIGSGVSDGEVDARKEAQQPGHACSLIYTSGTTGNPKAVMISHDNLVSEVLSAIETMPWMGQVPESVVSYLPLSHVAGQMIDIVIPVIISAKRLRHVCVWFARPDALKGSLPLTLQAARPTLFLGVPRVWEKIMETMKAKGAANRGLKLKLVLWAKSVGLAGALATQVGGSGRLPWMYPVANALVFKKVKGALGLDQCRFAFTGAAPITRPTLEFFGSLGLHIHEVYGMSECTGASSWSIPECWKFGSCGFAMPGQQLKLDHVEGRDKPGEGEVCFRGRNIMMGYMKEEGKTRDSIDSAGWLHSGDVGHIDGDGMLYITGRIKELIITGGGENIAPVPIEDELKRLMPAVSNVMMVGDKRKYNVMLVTLKQTPDMETGGFKDTLMGESAQVSSATTVAEAMQDPVWQEYITNGIKAYNNGSVCVSNAQKVQKFRIVPTDFSIPGDELTPTMKLKRTVVSTKYADIIEGMYAE